MKVREIMTSNPACATPDTPLQEVARMMVDNDCGEIPIVDDPKTCRPVGVVTDRDIVCRAVAIGASSAQIPVRDVMTAPPITVRPDTPVEDCCQLLEEKQIRRAPVTDEEGRCCGIISLADIAQTAPERLTGELVRTVSQRTVWASDRARRANL